MNRFSPIIIISISLISCNSGTKNSENEPLTSEQKKSKLRTLKLDFDDPVIIDSSDYVMYPLGLDKDDDYGSSSSSSSTFWNIIFYNPIKGDYHLLDENRKMVIYSYSDRNSKNGATKTTYNNNIRNGSNQVEDFLYFSVITLDFNNDKRINYHDPYYLFISDKSGKNFRQISPDSANVNSWEILTGTNKILMQVSKDSNKDKKFDYDDEVIPMICNLDSIGKAREIFNPKFRNRLKNQLLDYWPNQE